MRSLERILRRLVAPFLAPWKRFLDGRLRDSEDRLAERLERLAAGGSSPALTELLAHVGHRLRQLAEETRDQGARLEAIEELLRASHPGTGRGADERRPDDAAAGDA